MAKYYHNKTTVSGPGLNRFARLIEAGQRLAKNRDLGLFEAVAGRPTETYRWEKDEENDLYFVKPETIFEWRSPSPVPEQELENFLNKYNCIPDWDVFCEQHYGTVLDVPMDDVVVKSKNAEQIVIEFESIFTTPDGFFSAIAQHLNVNVKNTYCQPDTGHAGLTEFGSGEDEARFICQWDCIYEEERNDWHDLLYEDQELWRENADERTLNERRFQPDVYYFLEENFNGEVPGLAC